MGTREYLGFQMECRLIQTLKNGYVVTYRLFVGFWSGKKLADMTDGPVLRMCADNGRVFVPFVPSVC